MLTVGNVIVTDHPSPANEINKIFRICIIPPNQMYDVEEKISTLSFSKNLFFSRFLYMVW